MSKQASKALPLEGGNRLVEGGNEQFSKGVQAMSKRVQSTEPANHIAVFQEPAIRRARHEVEWWFSGIDVVGILSETAIPKRYWSDLKLTAPDGNQEFARAWESGEYAGETMSFESPATLFRLLTPARWGVLDMLQRTGRCGVRELARRLGRDASAVHRDISALIERGLVEKDEDGKLFVPFSHIHAEFDLAKAA